MKNKFPSHLWRGAAVAIAALALAGANGLARSPATPVAPAIFPSGQPAAVGNPTGSAAAKAQAAAEDIRDIRGPIPIPPPLRWPWWLAGAAALAALGYGGWRRQQRRARAAALLPYKIALARLEAARALMQPENAREFSILVSEIVRQFIEVRFQVRAARRTTEEFLRDLIEPSDVLLASHRESLAGFLRHCDLAKFARWILSIQEMTIMLQSAQEFVLESGPTPDPAAAPEQSAAAGKISSVSQPITANP